MSMLIEIEKSRPFPTKFGEFYPSTGEIAQIREDTPVLSFRDAMLMAVRDLGIYYHDLEEVKSSFECKKLSELTEQVLDMFLYYGEYFKAIYLYTGETPEEKTDLLKQSIEQFYIPVPMNPLEEFAGAVYALSKSYSYDLSDTMKNVVVLKAREDLERLDRINDVFWGVVDRLEAKR